MVEMMAAWPVDKMDEMTVALTVGQRDQSMVERKVDSMVAPTAALWDAMMVGLTADWTA
jgi:hypothetical protein